MGTPTPTTEISSTPIDELPLNPVIEQEPIVTFDYDAIGNSEVATGLQADAKYIVKIVQQAGLCSIAAGLRLLQAKRREIPYGLFEKWVKTACGMTPQHARRLMKVAKTFEGVKLDSTNLPPASVLYDLIASDDPDAKEAVEAIKSGDPDAGEKAKAAVKKAKAARKASPKRKTSPKPADKPDAPKITTADSSPLNLSPERQEAFESPQATLPSDNELRLVEEELDRFDAFAEWHVAELGENSREGLAILGDHPLATAIKSALARKASKMPIEDLQMAA